MANDERQPPRLGLCVVDVEYTPAHHAEVMQHVQAFLSASARRHDPQRHVCIELRPCIFGNWLWTALCDRVTLHVVEMVCGGVVLHRSDRPSIADATLDLMA